MKTNRFLTAAGLLLATTLILSCSALDNLKAEADKLTGNLKAGFLQNSALGFQSGGFPDAELNGQTITSVKVNGDALTGGSTMITVVSTRALSQLHIKITGDGAGEGYYVWTLQPEDLKSSDDGEYTYEIFLQFNQDLGSHSSLKFTVSGVTKQDEQIEPYDEEIKLDVINAGGGAMQISLSWDTDDDVDLHVYTPSNGHLYWGSREEYSALKPAEEIQPIDKGELDIDSNMDCRIDGKNCENIFFKGPLIDGDYRIEVALYRKCVSSNSKSGASYNLTVNLNGTFITVPGGKQRGEFDNADEGHYPNGTNTPRKVIGTINIADGKCTNCIEQEGLQEIED